MNAQERFAELWTDYLEGELDESGITELQELLAGDEDLLRLAADLFHTHRLLGLVAAEEPARHEAFVRDTLARLPKDSDRFTGDVMQQLGESTHQLPEPASLRSPTVGLAVDTATHRRDVWQRVVRQSGWIVATLSFALLLIVWSQADPRPEMVASRDPQDGEIVAERGTVRFASLAHARFFGELSPPLHSVLTPRRDYVLMSGLVEVAFPAGASAILEGPAVFRVMSDDCLALDVGRCSVHAPDGAEGFHVETPVTRVVDRGTRFTVSVAETSETEVQVNEGAADVYRQPAALSPETASSRKSDGAFEVRLTSNEAKKFAHVGEFSANSINFDPSVYRSGLPDRIVAYEATRTASGRAENLLSVTVQRGGRVAEIPIGQIIPVEVIGFTGQPGFAYLASNGPLPPRRSDTASDASLVTGVINPGGSRTPLTDDPVIEPDSSARANTPGLAIRFREAVVNGPGPDVVFFDLQTFSNPPDGDAFHVSPLKFREGLRSHTIRVYDLTMESPAALELEEFQIHMFKEPVTSLSMLEEAECTARSAGMKFRGLAVGIDLSDLGYDEGETVDGLFIQDALDDDHIVDPVFIGGLPTMQGSNP